MNDWTISLVTKDGQRTIGTFATKREAVNALMTLREPKTPIYRNGRNYVFHESKVK